MFPQSKEEQGKSKGGKGKKGKGQPQSVKDDSDDDDWSTSSNKKKAKKKGKGKASKKKQAANNDDDDDDFSSSKGKGGKKARVSLSIHKIKEKLEESERDIPEELYDAIAAKLISPLLVQYEAAKQAILTSGASDRRKAFDALHTDLQGLYDHILLFQKAALTMRPPGVDEEADSDDDSKEEDEKAIEGMANFHRLERHLLKTMCSTAVDLLLYGECIHNSIPLPGDVPMYLGSTGNLSPTSATSEGSESPSPAEYGPHIMSQPFSTENRRRIASALAGESSKVMLQLIKSLSNKTTEEFMTLFEAAAKSGGFFLSPLDKKKERHLVLTMRESLKQSLNNITDPGQLLQTCVVVLHAQATGTMLHAPSKCVRPILDSLEDKVNAESWAQLDAFCNGVMKQIRSTGDEDEEDDGSGAIKENMEFVRAIGQDPKNVLN